MRSIAEIYATHDRESSPYQRAITRLIDRLGRPISAAIIAAVLAAWLLLNLAMRGLRLEPIDPPPFPYLQDAVSCAALLVAILILAAQRHENRLAERRAHVTLEMTMISESKIAKLIELVENQRRDNPQMADRVDEEADEMAKRADPQAIADAIAETQGELVAEDEHDEAGA